MVVLRLVFLDADAYPHLSWSAALLTDEGFYLHNARNAILFHRFQTDDFNNALIMPLLHVCQLGWFRVFGVSAVSARLLSVAFSLGTLGLFFAALRRAFGSRVAWLGTILLGLDHVNLLYNRLALMDTPAAFWMVAAFYAWVVAAQACSSRQRYYAFLACGLLLGAVYATRGVAAFLIPVPFLLLLWQVYRMAGDERRTELLGVVALTAGLGMAMSVYLLAWYLPHHAEIGRLNHYYLNHQLLPHSLNALRANMTHAVIGDHRGLSPYLFRHTPIQFALVLAGLFTLRFYKPEPTFMSATHHASRITHHFLTLWLLFAWLAYACISYAPDRYYALFYPALAALAALALADIQNVIKTIWSSPLARTTLGGFLAYHFAEAFLHHASRATDVALDAFTVGMAAVLFVAPRFAPAIRLRANVSARLLSAAPTILLLLWAGVNAGWTLDWLTHLRYSQRDADAWLAHNLPPNTVLLGDVAPGLCLNNHFRAINVIPGLCNDDQPVERAAPNPVAIVILDANFKEPWWQAQYPALVAPSRRVAFFPRVVRFPVGVYYEAKESGVRIQESVEDPLRANRFKLSINGTDEQ